MSETKSHMEERILVCVYYGQNGERLIRRGYKLAQLTNVPFYVFTADRLKHNEFDADKASYIKQWQELSQKLGAEKFILKDNETRPIAKAVKEVAYHYDITQVIIGERPQNRWEEMTHKSFINTLLKELVFVDIHIVSVDRTLQVNDEATYEQGVRGFLKKDNNNYILSFKKSKNSWFEGVFYKEVGTDFNSGIFKFIYNGESKQVHVVEDKVEDSIKEPSNLDKE